MCAEHYFSARPQVASARREWTAALRGATYTFVTDRGVFSWEHIDRGTRLLIETMAFAPEATVLDWGCGYGPLGLVAARLAPQGRATLLDVNERAVELARENARRNGIANVDCVVGDGFAAVAGQRFDVILSNPPLRAGKGVVQRLVDEAPAHLKPGGSLWLVARTQQGAKGLLRSLEQAFDTAETVARGGGFRVLRGVVRVEA
jgi:16S rRNA (guanine1207-N2)-methyltransferase